MTAYRVLGRNQVEGSVIEGFETSQDALVAGRAESARSREAVIQRRTDGGEWVHAFTCRLGQVARVPGAVRA